MISKTAGQDLSPTTYQILMDVSPICVVDILFFNPEKTHILLGRRIDNPYKGVFYAFGGRLRKNERLEDAAIRIVKQETAINLDHSDIVLAGTINEISSDSKFEGVNYHAVVLYFYSMIPVDTVVTLDEQHAECKWFSVDDPSLHPNIKKRITGALRSMNTGYPQT